LRGFFSTFSDPVSAEELAGLACEEAVESRLVVAADQQDKQDWQLQLGPLSVDRFASLPQENWTLLVQAVDQWIEAVAQLKSAFDFIPNWRIDDVMVSYAVSGGGVGPHFDYYDVFLLQGSGSRNWRVGPRVSSSEPIDDKSGLALMQSFTTAEEYVLNPGDVLYIPPRFAHWGTAIEDSLCYSIGFRAPALAEMIEGFSDSLIAAADPAIRFVDPDPQLPTRAGEINPHSLQASLQQLSDEVCPERSVLPVVRLSCHPTQIP
jgi:50S ribosomal protein L16 3-hydroxylase